jgi:hypothetical protein
VAVWNAGPFAVENGHEDFYVKIKCPHFFLLFIKLSSEILRLLCRLRETHLWAGSDFSITEKVAYSWTGKMSYVSL